MLKGTIGLIIIAIIVWAFWMSWHWLRNNQKNYNKTKENKQDK